AGAAGAAAFCAEAYVASAFLFGAHLICDGLDGYVARLTGQASFTGFLVDHVLDRLSDVLIFTTLGLSLGLEREGFALVIVCLLSSYVGLLPRLAGGTQDKSGLFAKTYRYQLLILATFGAAWSPESSRTIFQAYFLGLTALGLVTILTRGT